MRLLHTERLEFGEFYEPNIPPYAILSHRWGKDEISYAEFLAGQRTESAGYIKVIEACAVAADYYDYDWIWIDTCCINKDSSTEVSEAINSMYKWYYDAQLCLAYLHDVSEEHLDCDKRRTTRQFRCSKWFTRGWTLQELLAPSEVMFLNSKWRPIATKYEFAPMISEITKIHKQAILNRTTLSKWSVAARMSWASRRRTTRVEDQAYCLLGLFGVNMPLLYGEGLKAFKRLQEEIIRVNDDESIFAWALDVGQHFLLNHNVFAREPSAFANCGKILTTASYYRQPHSITNRGLQMDIHLLPSADRSYLIPLNCSVLDDQNEQKPLMLRVRELSGPNPAFARLCCQTVTESTSKAQRTIIFLQTNAPDPSEEMKNFSNGNIRRAENDIKVDGILAKIDSLSIDWTKIEPNDLHISQTDTTAFQRVNEICMRAVQECGKVWGYEHPSTLNMTFKVGQFYEFENRDSEALNFYMWALRGYQNTEGMNSPKVKKIERKIQSLQGPKRIKNKKELYEWKIYDSAIPET